MDEIPVAVLIPSIGRSECVQFTAKNVVLEPRVDTFEVWDNLGKFRFGAPSEAAYVQSVGSTLYQEWNAFAARYGDTHHLAILNDDIVMAHGTLDVMAGALDDGFAAVSVAPAPNEAAIAANLYYRKAAGTYRNGGLCGWAFMVARGAWQPIDERFNVWYGDDDLFWKIRQAGGELAVIEGLTVYHEISKTVNSLAWVPRAQAEDQLLWNGMGRP